VLAGLAVTVLLLSRESGDAAAPVPTASTAPTASPTPSSTTSPAAAPEPVPGENTESVEYPDLRADGLDPLKLRMSKDQALATGAVVAQDVSGMSELIPDPGRYPGVAVSYETGRDLIQAFTVKDGSPITTPDGIGVASTVDDLRDAYGVLLQEREENGDVWYLVPVDDVGYAFFPGTNELVMVSATDLVLEGLRPGQNL